jgi:hypothetical protein
MALMEFLFNEKRNGIEVLEKMFGEKQTEKNPLIVTKHCIQ